MTTLFAGLLIVSCQATPGVNLVVNSNLAREWEGWGPAWSRKEGAAKAVISPGRSSKGSCIVVNHDDSQDWAVSQVAQIPVKPRQIYEISGWMKAEGGSPSISVVSRDESNQTLKWDLGSVGSSRSDWTYVHRLFVIPTHCRTIQFRMIGYGAGKAWLEAPSLTLNGSLGANSARTVKLVAGHTSLELNGDGSMTMANSNGSQWKYRAWDDDILIKSIQLKTAVEANVEALDLQNNLSIKASFKLDPKTSEATITDESTGEMTTPMPALGPLVTKPGEWVVLPMNEGIRLPVEDKTIDGWALITYGGHGLCMPWSGVINPATGAGTMTIIETPDDADVHFHQIDGCLSFQPRWEPSRQAFGYKRRIRLVTFEKGGFVTMAKRYRSYAKSVGLFKTLASKRAANPNVDRLIGAVNVWNWDMDKLSLCNEMKRMGFEHVLWSSGGNADQIREITKLGYLPGRYDIYQDVWDPKHSLSWQNTAGWPNDLVLERNGDWMKGWNHPDKHADGTITWYQGGVISSGPGLARAKTMIPQDLNTIPYLARFIDTTTASPFREDYNPLHPLTRTQDRENKMSLLSFCSNDMKLVTGTETGIDPSVPVVDYYEGMMSLGPFRLPDSGTFMMEYRTPTPEFLKFQVGYEYRIPLWELVYHDCTVAQWYWGDATNKAPEVWDQRDLLNILYGTPPLLMFDKDRWQRDKGRMLQTYQNVCNWVRKIGYDEMVSHQDLTPDHSVQKTTWSSGRSVIVNFGDTPYKGINAKSFQLSGPI